MDTILLDLQGYLSSEINGKSAPKLSDKSLEFEESLNLECKRIRKAIHLKFIIYDGDKSKASGLITFLQRELTSFRNEVASKGPHYSSLSLAADNLIDFLRDEYPSFFNEQLMVPIGYANAKIVQRESLVNKFINAMNVDVADPGLIVLVSDYLRQNGYTIRTYTDINYYIQFADKFEILIEKASHVSLQTRVIEQLYYINFNCFAFISYCGDIYSKHLDEKLTRKSSSNGVYEILIRLIQKPQHKSLIFDRTDKTVRTALKELTNFEQEHVMALENSKAKTKSPKPWITAQMNVQVLMILVEAARKAKAFTYERFVDAYSFIEENIGTKNNEGPFTKGGMKNRKNEAGQRSAIEALRHLENMIEQIKIKFNLNELKGDND